MGEFFSNQFSAQSTSGDSVGSPLAGGFIIIFSLIAYVVVMIPTYKIAQKCGAEHPWLVIIPLANLWGLVVEMAELDWWYILLFLIPLVNIFVVIYVWMKIAENAGFPSWMGVLIIVPLVNIAILYYMAFGKSNYASN